MSDSSMSTASGQDREGAAAAMRDLPGETARGHVDPATVREHPGDVSDIDDAASAAGFVADRSAQRDGDPSSASSQYQADLPQDDVGGLRPLEQMDRSDASLGDRSTGGQAAEQALGVDPERQGGGEIEDRSTGEATRENGLGDGRG